MPSVPRCDFPPSRLSTYIAITIQNILYGVDLALYFETAYIFLTHRQGSQRIDKFYVLFSSLITLLITVWIIAQAHFGQALWVPSEDGSSLAASFWHLYAGTVTVIALQLMTDALMIYRCWKVWNNSLYVIIIPSILWVASLALGILMTCLSTAQAEDFLIGFTSIAGIAYYTVTVSLNVILTGMICYRLLQLGKLVEDLGQQYASVYFSIATLVIESMLPCAIAGIAFLISFGLGSPTVIVFMSVYLLLMCLSSQILIFRVSTRKLWPADTARIVESEINFSPRPAVRHSNG